MAYTPTVWENDETELDEDNMNHIEQGIKDNDDKLQGLTSMGSIVVDSIRSKNLFDVNTCIGGNLDNGAITGGDQVSIISKNQDTGTIVFSATEAWRGVVSYYIEVEEGQTYFIKFTRSTSAILTFVQYFDSNKQMVGVITEVPYQTAITVPSSAKYVRFVLEPNSIVSEQITLSNIQFEKGNSATTFTPFQNLSASNYQEGTFLPTISGIIPGGTTTYSRRDGHYINIGQIVFYEFQIECTLTGSSGDIYITGMPNISNALEPAIGNAIVSPAFDSNHTMIQLRKHLSGVLLDLGNLDSVSNQNWSSTKKIYGSGFYILQ